MRIISFLLMVVVIVALVGASGFFITREVLLQAGVSQLKSSVSTLRTTARNTGSYLLECRQKLQDDTIAQPISSLQLRFTSDTTYQLEVVCQRFASEPIILANQELPPLVRKVPGFSGLLWDEQQVTSVGLELWGRQRFVTLASNQVETSQTRPESTTIGSLPVTTCQGFGYQCCSSDAEVGQGQLLSAASDCPQTCYAQCDSRPVVLSLATDPLPDYQTKIVTVTAGEPVLFNYLVSAGGVTGPLEVQLDTGDGQQLSASTDKGSLTHSYTCAQAECRYQATLTVTNAAGVSSQVTPISQVTIVVR